MGYTHYWTKIDTIDPKSWEGICADVRLLLAASPVPLAFEYDQPSKPPYVGGDLIRFNGCGDDGHETFYFERVLNSPDVPGVPAGFAFCKTAQKPYDAVVCGVLAAIAERAIVVEVSSDGGPDDWRQFVVWASTVLKRPLAVPLKRHTEA